MWLSVIVELSIQGFYHIHHKLWVFTDYILEKAGKSESPNYFPHSFYTTKRYD